MQHVDIVIQGSLILLFSIIMSWSHIVAKKSREYVMELFAYLKFSEKNLDEMELQKLSLLPPGGVDFNQASTEVKLYFLYGKDRAMVYEDLKLAYYAAKVKPDDAIENVFKNMDHSLPIRILLFTVWIFTIIITLLFFLPVIFWTNERINKKEVFNVLYRHPESRSAICKSIIGAVCIEILVIVFLVFNTEFNLMEKVIAGYMLLSIIANIIYFFIQIRNQEKWKKGWKDIFDFIMQKAVIDENYDVYNHAYNLSVEVKSVPAIPLSGLSKVYIVVFSITHFLIPYLLEFLHIKKS